MEYASFVVREHPVLVAEKEYTVRNCTPKLSTSEYEIKKRQANDKLYSIFSKYQK